MLEELQSLLSDVKTNINEILKNKDQYADASGVDGSIARVLSNALVEAGKQAVDQIEEFQYPALKYQFLENLAKPEHIKIFGNSVKIFDEQVAGTHADLIAGQEAAGGHTGTPNAPTVWKYGIYLANSSEGWPQAMIDRMKLPTYEEVISERLSAWGDKAPYWYFIENGNAGNSRAFPSFSGYPFIEELRAKAPEIVRRAKELYLQRVFYDLSEATELGVNIAPKSRTRVTIYKYKIGQTNVSIQKTSAGNIFYRIGNKYFTADEFEKIIDTLL